MESNLRRMTSTNSNMSDQDLVHRLDNSALEVAKPGEKIHAVSSSDDERSYRIVSHEHNQSGDSYDQNTTAATTRNVTNGDGGIKDKTRLFLEPTLSGDLSGNASMTVSPSISPRIYTSPLDYIDYSRTNFEHWFDRQKHAYVIAVQESAAALEIGLPEFIADMIVIDTVLLPGCYTLTGLLFPAARNEADLFAEYANKENGYVTNKTEKGIAYKRKKPMINVRRPENNTASLWLDEDGTICGFRCIWVPGVRGKLMVDQKFCVLDGAWSLSGEMTLTFEQWESEDVFEATLEEGTFCGRWSAGHKFYGEFQWFITVIESFYLAHNIAIDGAEVEKVVGVDAHGHQIVEKTRLAFHDSMGHSTEDEFDLEEDIMLSPVQHAALPGTVCDNNNHQVVVGAPAGVGVVVDPARAHVITKVTDPAKILYNKAFDIVINESLTIRAKFLKHDHKLELSEKQESVSETNLQFGSSSDDFFSLGYGTWYRNGKMSFQHIKYQEQKFVLAFNGCCDGSKVLGRLFIYHDNTPTNKQPMLLAKTSQDDDDALDFLGDTAGLELDDEDDDDEQLLMGDEDDEDDDEDRMSFIQMIIVANIVPV